MNQKYKYLFKNLGILTVSNFSSKILVFLLVPLYTSVLSTEEYGIYDLSVSTVQLLYPILTVNIVDAVMRFSMDKKYSGEDVAYIGAVYVLRSYLIFAALSAAVGYFHLLPDFSGLEYLIFLYFVSYVANQYFIQLAKGMEYVSMMAVASIIGTAAMVGANLLFLLVFKWGLRGFYLANIFAQAFPALFYFSKLDFPGIMRASFKKYMRGKERKQKLMNQPMNRKPLQKEMVQYCAPLIFTTLGWWANNTADKYVVSFMCGMAANGILSVAYKIPQILNVIQSIFTQAWQISAVKEYGKEDTARFYGRSFKLVNLGICLCCSLLLLCNKWLAGFLYAKDFYVAWRYVPFLLVSSVLNTASGFLGPVLAAGKDSKSMARSAIYGTAANIVMNIVLVYFIGMQGATIATMISSYVIYYVRLRSVKGLIEFECYWKIPAMWAALCLQAAIAVFDLFIVFQFVSLIILFALNAADIQIYYERGEKQMKVLLNRFRCRIGGVNSYTSSTCCAMIITGGAA